MYQWTLNILISKKVPYDLMLKKSLIKKKLKQICEHEICPICHNAVASNENGYSRNAQDYHSECILNIRKVRHFNKFHYKL